MGWRASSTCDSVRFDFAENQMNILVPEPGNGVEDASATTTVRKGRTLHIIIAEGHSIFREGLRALLEGETDFRVVGVAEDGQEALHLVKQLKPEVLLLDLLIPQSPGSEALKQVISSSETLRCVVLTPDNNRTRFAEALELGAHGVVSKEFPTEVLVHCIRHVMEGKCWVGSEAYPHREIALQSLRGSAAVPEGTPRFGLTKREMQIVTTVVAGYTNKEISQKFGISEDTVKHHLSNIYDKVGVYNRLELALFAVHHALIRKS